MMKQCDWPERAAAARVTERKPLEETAARLAGLAGEYLSRAHADAPAVAFKQPLPGSARNSNPVSRVDREVELLLREQLVREFPDDAIVGEEQALRPGGGGPFTWVIDPLDGTTNYLNGLPLFGAAVGVICQGYPIAGAIWCASSHAGRSGVYHATAGGPLCFEGELVKRRPAAQWRGLAAEPGMTPTYGEHWDTRVLGCATLESAFVAAGLLRLAYLPRPALWDVVAGLVLLGAADCRAVAWRAGRWEPLLYFGAGAAAPAAAPELARWSEPVLIGDASALARVLHVTPARVAV